MAHRVALYTVRVKKKYANEYPLFGDLDGGGSNCAHAIQACLRGFEQRNEAGTKIVKTVGVDGDDDEVQVTLQHGENGVAADIVDALGAFQYRQKSRDTHLLRCVGLFVLPRPDHVGWLALHVNNNRGVKGLLETGLRARFGQRFNDLSLEINPFVDGGVLQQAVDEDRIATVRLVKMERPDDRAVAATQKWVRSEDIGHFELKVSAGRGKRVKAALIKRFLSSKDDERTRAFGEIVEFQGVAFDSAKVEVILANDTRRTFNIESPESGHPMTVDLEDLEFEEDGEPKEADVLRGLRNALQSVVD